MEREELAGQPIQDSRHKCTSGSNDALLLPAITDREDPCAAHACWRLSVTPRVTQSELAIAVNIAKRRGAVVFEGCAQASLSKFATQE